jgi:hypothetical protein
MRLKRLSPSTLAGMLLAFVSVVLVLGPSESHAKKALIPLFPTICSADNAISSSRDKTYLFNRLAACYRRLVDWSGPLDKQIALQDTALAAIEMRQHEEGDPQITPILEKERGLAKSNADSLHAARTTLSNEHLSCDPARFRNESVGTLIDIIRACSAFTPPPLPAVVAIRSPHAETTAPPNIVPSDQAIPGNYPNPGSTVTRSSSAGQYAFSFPSTVPARTSNGESASGTFTNSPAGESAFPFATCSISDLPPPHLTLETPGPSTGSTALSGGSSGPQKDVSNQSGVLTSDGVVVFLTHFRACELQVEMRYADYYRARKGADSIDYDLQIAHAYCHAPRVTDNRDEFPDVPGTVEYPVAPKGKPFMSDADYNNANLWIEVQNQYPRLYELLSFCQNVATETPQPNSKRLLCNAGTPGAAFITLIASLFSKNGLSTTLAASSLALSSVSSCGSSGGGGSGSKNGSTSSNSSNQAGTPTTKKGP